MYAIRSYYGTGNKDFCTSINFQCPATPSKCYSLPPGAYIAIETPQSTPTTITECSNEPAGSVATFNLSAHNDEVTTADLNTVTITWWEDAAATTSEIDSPAAYLSSATTVYAKITNNQDANAYSIATVTLVVNSSPTLTGGAICLDVSGSAGTLQLSGSGIPARITSYNVCYTKLLRS